MELVRGLDNITRDPNASLTIGSFDGLHLGHQRILQQMRKLEYPITVLTFDPHPQSIVRSDKKAPPLLTSFEERLELYERFGVTYLIVLTFDEQFAKLSPEEFIEDIIVKKIGLGNIFIGPRHRFGSNRKGNVELLRKMGRSLDFKTNIVNPVNRFGEIISSSRIRRLIQEGDALTAWRCLGRPYYLDGTVVKGDGRGKRLGFPSANLEINDLSKIEAPHGIYATVTEVNGIRLPSVSHFGPRPTFIDAKPSIETHILGFNRDIYGMRIRVGLIDLVREIKTFTSAESLVEQLHVDARTSLQRLAELGFGKRARLRIQRYGKVLH